MYNSYIDELEIKDFKFTKMDKQLFLNYLKKNESNVVGFTGVGSQIPLANFLQSLNADHTYYVTTQLVTVKHRKTKEHIAHYRISESIASIITCCSTYSNFGYGMTGLECINRLADTGAFR